LAPDLYSAGPRALCVARAVLSMQLGGGPALKDLEAARSYLASRPEVRADRLGVAGFCMGGGFALLLARTGDFRIAAPFYGAVPRRARALDGICPVVGGYGAEDRVFAPQGRRLGRHLESLGVRHDVRLYDGVGHSYMNEHEPSRIDGIAERGPMRVGYNAEAAEDSWKRLLAWFGEHLGAD
jgi:carboxymethylenebutenolidase